MPRVARALSSSGIYHVMVRGVRGESLFLDDRDRRAYLRFLASVKKEAGLIVYGYCLMPNHVHLLIGEGQESLGTSMKRLGVAYAMRFNNKHGRDGYVFQGRYRSEAVEDDDYFLTALRYIHQNPVKAGIVGDCASFRWSSHRAYADADRASHLVSTQLALQLMGNRQRLLNFLITPNADHCLDVEERAVIDDDQIRARLEQLLQGRTLADLSLRERNRVLCQLKEMHGASIRQIAQAIGVGKRIVERA